MIEGKDISPPPVFYENRVFRECLEYYPKEHMETRAFPSMANSLQYQWIKRCHH